MDSLSEEKYPLLLLYVEEGGKRSEYPRRVVFADRARGKKIIQGAANIITQSVNTSCWITSIVLGTSFILLAILLMVATLNPTMYNNARPRCIRGLADHRENKTIHIVHENTEWNPKQIDILKYIADIYSDYEIHVLTIDTKKKYDEPNIEHNSIKIIVDNENITKPIETTSKKNENVLSHSKSNNEGIFLYNNPFRTFNPFTFIENLKRSLPSADRFPRSADETLKENILLSTYENVIKKYKNINSEKTNYKNYFLNTPLQYSWMNMDSNMLLFASRIQELWQYGGLSFYLPPNYNNKHVSSNIKIVSKEKYITEKKVDEAYTQTRLKNVIANSKSLFEQLKDDLVSIDGKGLHMGTKTACHTFFGEMIIKLLSGKDSMSVPTLIQDTLDAFCKRGAVDKQHCKAIKNQ